jgi:tetratricopeptide (TPR) repeat protein
VNGRSLDFSIHDFSSPELMKLTAEEQERLTEILDRFMRAQEQGLPLDQGALLAEHPDLADALRIYFRSLEQLHDVAAGFGRAAADEPVNSLPQEPGRLGDFELLKEIGRGGMGVVYEARQISLNRRVAVKLLPFAAVLSAKQIARFKHEAQAAAHVQHPNIVPVFAIGVERGVHYYAMQFIDGQPLDRAIAELRRGLGHTTASSFLSGGKSRQEFFETVAGLGIQAAEALQAAHEYGVVHRDIKPSNLLLEAEGKIWVTDFGLARFQRNQTLTRTGDLVGTMKYMSPEQAAGRPEMVDHRTDIYSLGATLYELLCWQPAFSEQDGPALLKKIERIEPPRPREVRRDIPADLENIILKAMAKDRVDRYANAEQLAADLKCFLAGQPTLARPLSRLDRAMKWGWRQRRSVTAGVAVLILAVVALTFTTVQFGRQKSRAEKNVARADRYLNDARQVLDRFGVQLAERLAEVPGAEDVRRELLQETCAYYQHFVAEASGDPALRGELAVAYGKLAKLLNEAGSYDEGLAAQQKSVQLYGQLAVDEPARVDYQKGLALSQNNLALMLARQGKPDEAKSQFTAAIERQRSLVKRLPQDAAIAGDLAASLGNYGLLQNEVGSVKEARSSFEEAIELLKKHGKDNRKQAAAYNNLAATYVASEPHRAAALHEQALHLLEAETAALPDDRALSREVALTLSNLGSAWSRTDSPEKALNCYLRAIAIQTKLVRVVPAAISYQRDLAVSHNNLGLLHSRANRMEQAEQEFTQALKIYAPLVEKRPQDAAFQSSLAGIYNNLGIVLENSSRLEPAAEAFANAVLHQQAAVSLSADAPRYNELLGKHQVNRQRVLKQLGRADEATGLSTL